MHIIILQVRPLAYIGNDFSGRGVYKKKEMYLINILWINRRIKMQYRRHYTIRKEGVLTPPPPSKYATGLDILSKIPFGFIDIRFSREKLSKIKWRLGFSGTFILILVFTFMTKRALPIYQQVCMPTESNETILIIIIYYLLYQILYK